MNTKSQKTHSYVEDSSCSDIIYYNVIMVGNTAETNFTNPFSEYDVLAKFEENRVQPIIDKCSDFYMSVVRFSVDSASIPIFICNVIINPNNALDVNFTPFVVTLSCNGVDYSENLRFYTENAGYIPNPPTSRGQDNTSDYYYIYQYTTFINMLNTAINVCFTNLTVANPQYIGQDKPYFQFNKTANVIEYIVPNIIVSGTNTYITQFVQPTSQTDINPLIGTPIVPQPANTIYLYLNQKLYQYYSGIDSFYNPIPIKSNLMTVRDLKNNYYYYPQNLPNNPANQIMTSFSVTYTPPPYNSSSFTSQPQYFINKQEFNTVELWNSLSAIVFTTYSIPIQNEYIPSTSFSNSNGNSGVASFRPILTDFVPDLTSGGQSSSRFVYYPTQYRFTQLLSDLPLTKFDLQMFWQDQYQQLHPLYISYNQSNSVKFMFLRKNLLKNYMLKAGT